jgi:hypothetical protein
MRRLLGAALCLFCLSACSSQPESAPQTATVDRDTLTRRQKDSITATLRVLPGAGVVGKALNVSDQAGARAADIDAQQDR